MITGKLGASDKALSPLKPKSMYVYILYIYVYAWMYVHIYVCDMQMGALRQISRYTDT